jgi:hypothetical protein
MQKNYFATALISGMVNATPKLHQMLQVAADLPLQDYDLVNSLDFARVGTTLVQTGNDPNQKAGDVHLDGSLDLSGGNGLAQLTTSVDSSNYCHFAHDRVKEATNIFYGVQQGGAEYQDPTFTKDKMIRWAAHPSNQGDLTSAANSATWTDSLDIIYDENNYSLWGSEHSDYGHATDVYQGSIGNCWFMHGASAVG